MGLHHLRLTVLRICDEYRSERRVIKWLLQHCLTSGINAALSAEMRMRWLQKSAQVQTLENFCAPDTQLEKLLSHQFNRGFCYILI